MSDTQPLIDAMRALAGRITELTELTRGNIVNHVLWSGTLTIPTGGVVSMDFDVPIASFAVQASITAGLVTVTGDPPAGTVPDDGVGVFTVGPDAMLCMPLTGRTVTIYGTATDKVALAVSTRPWPPAGA